MRRLPFADDGAFDVVVPCLAIRRRFSGPADRAQRADRRGVPSERGSPARIAPAIADIRFDGRAARRDARRRPRRQPSVARRGLPAGGTGPGVIGTNLPAIVAGNSPENRRLWTSQRYFFGTLTPAARRLFRRWCATSNP